MAKDILITPASGTLELKGSSTLGSTISVDTAGAVTVAMEETDSQALVVEGSGGTIFAVDGDNGRMFSVTDDMSGSIFSANTIAGLPVVEAFSDSKVTLGPYSNQTIIDASGNLTLPGTMSIVGTISTTSHGTSDNWNTAYGWGDHASGDYATQSYVNTQVSNLVDSAPGTLDTLNELAAALGDDTNFSTTVTNSIATKLPLAGGEMSNADLVTNLNADLLDGQHASEFASASHSHDEITSKGSYVWTASSTPRSFPLGVSTSFVKSADGWQNYGSVLNVRGYASAQDGGVGQIYIPYSSTYGGSSMQYRMGQYNNAGWTSWKTILDSSNYSSYALPSIGGTLTGDLTVESTGDVGITINADTDNVNEDDIPYLSFKMDGSGERLRLGVANDNHPYISTDSDLNLDLYIKGGTDNGNIAKFHGSSKSTTLYGSLTGTSATFSDNLTLPYGGATTPSIRWSGDTDTGIYGGSGEVRMTIGGTLKTRLDGNQLYSNTANSWLLDLAAASSTNPVFTFNGDNDTGLGRASANNLSLITGGSERVRINSTGVGIGTTNPATELEIYDSTAWSGTPELRLSFLGSGSEKFHGGILLSREGSSGYNSKLEFRTSTYSNNISTKMIIDSSGNVGIGTTGPLNKLHIAKASNGFNTVFENPSNTNGDYTGIGFRTWVDPAYSASKHAIFQERTGTYSRGKLHFAVRNTADNVDVTLSDTKMTIDETGNVGIGTDSPDEGNLVVQDASGGSIILESSDSGLEDGDVIGKIGFQTNDGSGSGAGEYAKIEATSVGTWDNAGSKNGETNLSFYTTNNEGSPVTSEAMRIQYDGNVGIGTTSPDALLHVYDDTTGLHDEVILDLTGIVTGSGAGNNERSILLGKTLTPKRQAKIAYDQGGSNGQLPMLSFWTGDNVDSLDQRMTILSTGNVGIGTASPNHTLSVGDFTGTVTGDTTVLIGGSGDTHFIMGEDTSNYGRLSWDASENSWEFSLTDGGSARANALVIDQTGYVGIGTDSPQAKLEIAGSDTVNALKITDSGGGDGFKVTSHTTQGTYLQAYDASHALTIMLDGRTDSSSRHVYFKNGGNVGIGKVDPVHELSIATTSTSGPALELQFDLDSNIVADHILGEIIFSGNDANINQAGGGQADNTSIGAKIVATATAGWDDITANDADDSPSKLEFYTQSAGAGTGLSSPRMTIDSSGRVGIGTDSPGFLLDVAGRIAATGNTAEVYLDSEANYGAITGYGDGSYQDLWLRTGSAAGTGVYIDTSGNVGIGTASPSEKLDVALNSAGFGGRRFKTGNGSTTGAGSANGFNISVNEGHGSTLSAGWHYVIQLTTTGTGTDTGASYIVWYNEASAVWTSRLISRSGSSSNHPNLTISGNNAVAYTNHGSGYGIRYTVESIYKAESDGTAHALGSDYHWQRDVSNLFYNDGRVGIGTDSPNKRLHINSSTYYDGLQINTTHPRIRLENNSSATYRLELTANYDYNTPVSLTGYGGNRILQQLFGSSELTLYTGNTERLRIDSDGNVGIGTDSPGDRLDVHGIGVGTATLRLSGSPNNSADDPIGSVDFYNLDTSSDMPAVVGKIEVQSAEATGAGGNMIFYTHNGSEGGEGSSPVEQARITSTGKVGIGTDSPGQLLHLYKTSGTTRAHIENTHATGQASLTLETADSNWLLYTKGGDNNKIHFYDDVNNEQRITIDNSGNVGIGTTEPSEKLAVQSAFTTSASDVFLEINSGHEASGGSDVTGDAGILFKQGGSGNVLRSAGAIISGREGNYSANSVADSYLAFETAINGTNTERLRIDSDGNVGIGTDSPNFPLEIVKTGGGDCQVGITTYDNDASDNTQLVLRTADGTEASPALVDDGDILGDIRFAGHDGSNFKESAIIRAVVDGDWSTTSGDNPTKLEFYTQDNGSGSELGTPNMVIMNDGKVGIGTTSPGGLLELNGGGSITAGGTLIVRQDGDGNGDGIAITSSHSTSHRIWKDSNGKLNIGSSSAPSSLVQDVSGNVGIGTTSPDTNLHIRQKATTGTSPIEFLRLEVNDIDNVNLGAGEGPSIDFYVGEDGTSEYSGRLAVVRNSGADVDAAGDMVFHTSADDASPSEMMRIRYDGNVGIANTNPAYKLDVSGQIRVNTAGSAAAPALLINDTDSGIYDAGNNAIGFSTAGTLAMIISGSQNVGIG